MLQGQDRYRKKHRAQSDKEMVEPYKHIEWGRCGIDSEAEVRALQSFRDKVVNGVREFPLETGALLRPLLMSLEIYLTFDPVYPSELDSSIWYGSKFEMEDLLGEPTQLSVDIDEENFLKLKNIHF